MLRFVMMSSILAGSAVMAEPVPLTRVAIQETLSGATLEIDAPMGNKLPITYGSDGTMAGKAGSLSWFLGSSADQGRWWVANDKLCNAWSKWFDAKTQCLELKRDGERIAWSRDDGETGTATIVARVAKPQSTVVALAGAPNAPRILNAAPGSAQIASLGGPMPAQLPLETQAQTPPTPVAVAGPRPKAASNTLPVVQPTLLPQATRPKPQRPNQNAKALIATPPQALEQTAPLSSEFGPPLKVAGVASDDVLNVRRGPAEHFPPVGSLPPQAQGVILLGRCLSEWCPVQHGPIRGWVNSYYLVKDTAN